MSTPKGSAAVALTTPESADGKRVARVANRLAHCAGLALSSVRGAEPENAAKYLVDVLDEIAPLMPRIRRIARKA